MRAVPFTLARWRDVVLQPEQETEPPTEEGAALLMSQGATWAYEDGAGHTIACGGLYPVGPGQAVAWSYIGADAGRHMAGIVRAMRSAIATHKDRWPIVRCTVVRGFAAGRRLMDLLGFVPLLGAEPIEFRARVYDVFERCHYGG